MESVLTFGACDQWTKFVCALGIVPISHIEQNHICSSGEPIVSYLACGGRWHLAQIELMRILYIEAKLAIRFIQCVLCVCEYLYAPYYHFFFVDLQAKRNKQIERKSSHIIYFRWNCQCKTIIHYNYYSILFLFIIIISIIFRHALFCMQ